MRKLTEWRLDFAAKMSKLHGQLYHDYCTVNAFDFPLSSAKLNNLIKMKAMKWWRCVFELLFHRECRCALGGNDFQIDSSARLARRRISPQAGKKDLVLLKVFPFVMRHELDLKRVFRASWNLGIFRQYEFLTLQRRTAFSMSRFFKGNLTVISVEITFTS